MPKSRARDKDVYAYRKLRRAILAESDVCHLCAHPGADTIDHLIPISRGGGHDPDNLRPAHGVNSCTTCGRRCNQERGNKARTAAGATAGTGPPPGCIPLPDSQRYQAMTTGQPEYWDTVAAITVSQRWYDD